MFKKLTDLSYRRTKKEAVGFYLAYFLMVLLLAGIFGGIAGLAVGPKALEFGIRFGNIVSILFCLAVSFLVLKKKRKTSDFSLIIVALFSGILAFFGGAMLGLIPSAYLTTK